MITITSFTTAAGLSCRWRHRPQGPGIYIGTLSKVLAPGLRLGFVAGARDFIERLAAYRSFVDLQGDAVMECAIAELLDDGLLQGHVRKTRRIYRSRLETLSTALRQQLGGFLTFWNPPCGTAIWARTRDAPTTTAWADAARHCGVIFDEGSTFDAEQRSHTGCSTWLCLPHRR